MAKKPNKNRKSNPKRPPKRIIPLQPLWTLERDGITNSGLNLHQNCPEQFSLSYIEGLTSKKLKEATTYGSLFHACKQFRGKLSPMDAMARYRREALSTHPRDKEYIWALDHLIKKVAAVFPVYEAYYPMASEPVLSKTESTFAVPVNILGVEFCVRGQRDGEILTPSKGVALWELKTRATINVDHIRHQLRADMQTLLYLWSLWKETGKIPEYLLYDVVKRPTLKVTRETLAEHYNRIALHARDNPAQYFFRWKVEGITETDLVRFETEILFPILRGFVAWWLEVRRVPFDRFNGTTLHRLNLNALCDPWKESDFYDYLILGKTEDYYRRSSPHAELQE